MRNYKDIGSDWVDVLSSVTAVPTLSPGDSNSVEGEVGSCELIKETLEEVHAGERKWFTDGFKLRACH